MRIFIFIINRALVYSVLAASSNASSPAASVFYFAMWKAGSYYSIISRILLVLHRIFTAVFFIRVS